MNLYLQKFEKIKTILKSNSSYKIIKNYDDNKFVFEVRKDNDIILRFSLNFSINNHYGVCFYKNTNFVFNNLELENKIICLKYDNQHIISIFLDKLIESQNFSNNHKKHTFKLFEFLKNLIKQAIDILSF